MNTCEKLRNIVLAGHLWSNTEVLEKYGFGMKKINNILQFCSTITLITHSKTGKVTSSWNS